MTSKAPGRLRFKLWSWIAGLAVAAVMLIHEFRSLHPEPPVLALHSVPFTISPGELPWPDRWLMRGPSWNWLWTVRSKVWPKNPSANLEYGLWELHDPDRLATLRFVAAKTNDDWSIRVLNLDQVAVAEAALNADGSGACHMRIISGEGTVSTLTGSLPIESYRIETALRMRHDGVDVTFAMTATPLLAPIGNTNQTAFAFEATVPDKGAVLLVSRNTNPARACLITVAKSP